MFFCRQALCWVVHVVHICIHHYLIFARWNLDKCSPVSQTYMKTNHGQYTSTIYYQRLTLDPRHAMYYWMSTGMFNDYLFHKLWIKQRKQIKLYVRSGYTLWLNIVCQWVQLSTVINRPCCIHNLRQKVNSHKRHFKSIYTKCREKSGSPSVGNLCKQQRTFDYIYPSWSYLFSVFT